MSMNAVTNQRGDRRARDSQSRQQHYQPIPVTTAAANLASVLQARIIKAAQPLMTIDPQTPNARSHQQPPKGAGRGNKALAK